MSNTVKESLITTERTLDILIAFSGSPYYQSVLLYGEYLERPYKPMCLFSLVGIVEDLARTQDISVFQNEKFKHFINKFATQIAYLICCLTTIDKR